MAYSATFTEGVSIGGVSTTELNTLSENGRIGFDEYVEASQTDYEIAFTLDVSATLAFYLVADKDVSFQTNNGAAPDNTIDLKAGIPYIWYTNTLTPPYAAYDAFLLTVDVTAVFITTGAGSTARVRCEAIYDPTPA